jgi:hypothetical protein
MEKYLDNIFFRRAKAKVERRSHIDVFFLYISTFFVEANS